MRTWFIAALTTVLLVGCSAVPRSFHPQQPLNPHAFSHEDFDQVLGAHVSDGSVNYPNIAVDSRFRHYLDALNRLDPNALATRDHRLVFWINAYNAFAIQGILEGYSPQTWWGQARYFVVQDYQVGGHRINLYDLEHQLLIPDFREPRIHFTIVCASQSCPKLRSQAFSPNQLDQQLDDSARQFINDPSRNRFDRAQKIAYLSKIFDWFTEDFVRHSGSLTNYVAQYVNDPDLARELTNDTYRVEFLEYDRNLNGILP